jgi:hypothetical protein
MLYKYHPDKIINFLELLLTNLENNNANQEDIKKIANKLVQSCLMSGNYTNALEYIGKIISNTQQCSFNPKDKNFNLEYFLINLVTLEIYFNLGRLNDCIELGDELFKNIDLNQIDESVIPEGFSKKQFEIAIFDALFFTSISKILQLHPKRVESIKELIEKLPQYTCFKLLNLIQEFWNGKNIIPELTEIAKTGITDKYSEILFPLLQAMIAIQFKDWENSGNYVYNAKLKALDIQSFQINYFCDLLIGYSYQNLGNAKKSRQIYNNILDLATQKGLKNIVYLSWYLLATTELQDNNLNLTLDILKNAILKIESQENESKLITVLFKSLYAEVLLKQNPQKNLEQALFCAEQAYFNAKKENLRLYLPNIANMLIFAYSSAISSTQSQELINKLTEKINAIKNSLSQQPNN